MGFLPQRGDVAVGCSQPVPWERLAFTYSWVSKVTGCLAVRLY